MANYRYKIMILPDYGKDWKFLFSDTNIEFAQNVAAGQLANNDCVAAGIIDTTDPHQYIREVDIRGR